MRVFLTGGTGFIGRRLARALLRRGWTVTALVRRPDSAEAQGLRADGAELAQGDVTERASMGAAMSGADIVVHNAGWYELGLTPEAGRRMREINIDGAANTLGLAVEIGVPRIVHVSSIVAYGDTAGTLADESFRRLSPPRSIYEFTKAAAHAIGARLQQRGAPLIMACPAQVIGPGDHSPFGYIVKFWTRGIFPPLFWTPEGTHSFVHVDDVAEGIALAAERGRPGEDYIFAAGTMRIRELIGLLSSTPGGMPVIGYLPPPFDAAAAGLIEPLLRAAGYPAFISREVVRATGVHFAFSGAKAVAELGWRPRPIEEAWRETLAAERAALGKAWES